MKAAGLYGGLMFNRWSRLIFFAGPVADAGFIAIA